MADFLVAVSLELSPTSGMLFAIVGLVFGLLGWRLVRYLAVVDAIAVALLLGMVLSELRRGGGLPIPYQPLAILLAIGLPWAAWRFPRWAVVSMSGLVGFLAMSILIDAYHLPLLAWLLLCMVASGFAMATHLTLQRHSDVFITGMHGGVLFVGGVATMLTNVDGLGGSLAYALRTYDFLPAAVVAAFSAIMISFQWADLERAADPF